MKFSCDQCHAQYMIADEKVGARGVKVKCKKCSNVIIVKPLAAQGDASPTTAPASSAPAGATAPAAGAFGNLFGDGASAGAPNGNGLGAGVVGGALGTFGQEAAGFGAAGAGSFGGGFAGSAAVAAPAPAASAGAAPDLGDFNLGALAASAAPAAAPSRRPAGEKEWYIAVDDSQIGPVDLGEIEQRWDAKELDDDSLAWKTGMADWMAIAEIPELAWLVTQKPHAKPAKLAAVAAATSGTGPVPAGGPVAFGGNGANEDVSWKPSAASALSSLVQEELVAAQAPKGAPAAPPAGVPDLGMPGFGAGDLFAGGGNAGAAAPAAPRQDPFAPPAPSWSVPVVPRQSTGGFKWMVPVFGVLGVGIIGLLVFLVWQQMRPPPRAGTTAVIPAAPQVAQQIPAPTAGGTVAPAPVPSPSTPSSTASEPRATTRERPRHETRETPREVARAEPPKETPREPKEHKSSSDPLEGIGGGGGGGEAKAALTRQDVMDGVKKNAASVAPCLKAARANGEIQPRSYTFTLDWTIRPDGSVARGTLKGPGDVLGSSLPACFANVMRSWRFPASQKELPISNFPFGPINIR